MELCFALPHLWEFRSSLAPPPPIEVNFFPSMVCGFVQGRGCNLPTSCPGLCSSFMGVCSVVLTYWGCRLTPAELYPDDIGPVCHRVKFSLFSSPLLLPRKRKEKKERRKNNGQQISPRQTASCASLSPHQDIPSCYVQLKNALWASHWTLCAPYVFVVT
jgi:hypothetical protein